MKFRRRYTSKTYAAYLFKRLVIVGNIYKYIYQIIPDSDPDLRNQFSFNETVKMKIYNSIIRFKTQFCGFVCFFFVFAKLLNLEYENRDLVTCGSS